MTTSTLFYPRRLLPANGWLRNVSFGSFIGLNKKGFITLALLGIIGGAVAAYIAAIYWTFGLGIAIQEESRVLHTLGETYAREAIAFEMQNSLLGKELAPALRLEKISSIKYLKTESVTASLPFSRP